MEYKQILEKYREILSHFIILSNGKSTRGDKKDSTSTCTRQVKKYTQNRRKWPLSELRQSCRRTVVLLLLLESSEDLGLLTPQKMLKLWNQPLLNKPRKAQKAFLK